MMGLIIKKNCNIPFLNSNLVCNSYIIEMAHLLIKLDWFASESSIDIVIVSRNAGQCQLIAETE